MPAPLSLDIRKRIVAAVEGGASCRAAADRFAVSESTAIKLVQRWEQTGSLEPGQMGGHRTFALAAHEAVVRELIAAAPDQSWMNFGIGWPSVASRSAVPQCTAMCRPWA